MIAVSGVLVVVAAALLVAGLAGSGLTLIYASIVLSLVAATALVLGVSGRGGGRRLLGGAVEAREPAPSPERERAAVEKEDETPAAVVRPPAPVRTREPLGDEPGEDLAPPADGPAEPPSAGLVYVLENGHDYHAEGCARLGAAVPEPIEVEEARELGYASCPACSPENSLGRPAGA